MEYYLDPLVTQVNRLPARARRFEGKAVSLNGSWLFRLFDRPEECGDFFALDADESAYSPITVPGNWQLQGFGKPVYTNYVYPWPVDGENGVDGLPLPWKVPKENPTGCYRTRFSLPEGFDGDVLLRFDGVETAYELYVNGTFAGYAEDSKLSSEFDVTRLVRPGENLLALKVFTFATSSYLEDQDYWYLCGIHRGAALICLPRTRIEDYRLEAVLDKHGAGGRFRAEVKVSRTPGYATRRVRARLYDPEGVCVGEGEAPVMASAQYTTERQPTAGAARVVIDVDAVRQWSPESPALYRAELELLDADGAVLDADACRVGFKRVEIENGILMINGRRALIFGVNRHEHAWLEGRAVTREHMLREIREMKRMNVNAVRTCHYPDSPLWYELCDEMGLLVLCECDLETHGVQGELSHDPAWSGAYIERAQRMVAQHANHACIYGWSLGNESGWGPSHAAMYGLIKEYDRTRICQYEAGNPGPNISDVRGHMYATEKEILAKLADPRDDRPVILVEYLYQIRNSGGRMDKFIDLMRRYERFQGGFVWDWQDKSLPLPLPDGGCGFGHGGDYGEGFIEPKEPVYMTNNGLVRADLAWKPVAYEVREAYAPILIEPLTSDNAWAALHLRGLYQVSDRSLTKGSEAFALEVMASDGEGEVLRRVPLELPALKPGEGARLDVTPAVEGLDDVAPLFLTFTVTRRTDGSEAACRQFRHRDGLPALAEPAEGEVQALEDADGALLLRAGGAEAAFDRQTGRLLRYSRDGIVKVLNSSLCWDRPYSGLDAEKGWGCREAMDAARSMEIACGPAEVTRGPRGCAVTSAFRGAMIAGRLSWTLAADGELSLALDVQAADGLMLPRFGVELELPGGLRRASYLGYGPMENYSDRLLAPRFARYAADVDALGFDFAPPSENGGHEAATELCLTDADGAGLRIRGEKPFHFDAHRYTVADCQKALHTHELPARDRVFVHLDAYHAPIGGDMAWSTMLDPADAPHGGFFALRARLA